MTTHGPESEQPQSDNSPQLIPSREVAVHIRKHDGPRLVTCSRCGASNPADNKFCGSCGNWLVAKLPSQQGLTVAQQPFQVVEQYQPAKHVSVPLLLAIGLALAMASIVTWFAFNDERFRLLWEQAAPAQAVATLNPFATNTPTITPTPSDAESVARLLQQIDTPWGNGDWPQVIGLLTQVQGIDPSNQLALDKLYAAYVNYGLVLLGQGKRLEAAFQFQNALLVNANGGEARQALLSLTPTPTPRPTQAPIRIPTATKAPNASITTLSGTGSADTQHITIPQGSVRVIISYVDSPQPGTVSQAETNYHNAILASIENWYQDELAIIQREIFDAGVHSDALALVRARQHRDSVNASYKRQVDAENQRYANAVALAKSQTNPTQISVIVNRASANAPMYLAGWTGSGNEQATFDAAGGSDYFFRVQAVGTWTITVSVIP